SLRKSNSRVLLRLRPSFQNKLLFLNKSPKKKHPLPRSRYFLDLSRRFTSARPADFTYQKEENFVWIAKQRSHPISAPRRLSLPPFRRSAIPTPIGWDHTEP